MGRKILLAVLILVVLYLGTGLAFHLKWENELAACREMRAARGEFVEPPVFSSFIRLSFQVIWWPFYVRENLLHFGDAFSTPCGHSL